MNRIIIICEGQTEQEFCKTLLQRYFSNQNITLQVPLIKKTMGGIANWNVLKREIETYLRREKDVLVTTLIDYYGIKDSHGFPLWAEKQAIADKNQRLDELEAAMLADMDENLRPRFVPYLQLHEFEGLLFSDKQAFYTTFNEDELAGEDELEQTFADFNNPEMINDGVETSPSHRLERIISGYEKVVYGCCLAEAIGLDKMRQKSPRFDNWLKRLETNIAITKPNNP
jgi:hypothetical protein